MPRMSLLTALPSLLQIEGVLQQALLSPEGPVDAVFLAGDFNCVMRPEDVWGGAPRVGNRGEGAAELADMLAAGGLEDVWGSSAWS